MPRSGPTRRRHVPMRTCVGCREVGKKRDLIRVVRGQEGVRIDPTGKASGRGAYLHSRKACWGKALKGPLARALRTNLSPADRERLLAYADGLEDEQSD